MWRNIVFSFDGLGLTQRDQAVRGLERMEAEVVDKQRQAAKPAWHTFAITPAPVRK
jgi:hypothetical protein